jgi:hypothetical protein
MSGADGPGGEAPLRSAFGDEQPVTLKLVIEIVLLSAFVALLALALVFTPRYFAWTALVVAPALLERRLGRTPGVVAAITAAYLYLFAHGRPRFEMHVTDRGTIRMSFALGFLGALAALANTRRPAQRELFRRETGLVKIERKRTQPVGCTWCGPKKELRPCV